MRLIAALALGLLVATPALAGPTENALLAKYDGSWKGSGEVTGPDSGKVVCRLTMKATNAGKLIYNGRCSFGSGAASFNGTMQYSDSAKRYEAVSTAQGINASTVGKQQGGGIVFATKAMDTTYGTASSTLTLGGDAIKLDFKLVDKKGQTTASAISFART